VLHLLLRFAELLQVNCVRGVSRSVTRLMLCKYQMCRSAIYKIHCDLILLDFINNLLSKLYFHSIFGSQSPYPKTSGRPLYLVTKSRRKSSKLFVDTVTSVFFFFPSPRVHNSHDLRDAQKSGGGYVRDLQGIRLKTLALLLRDCRIFPVT
jgi:hypothetical protein